MAAPAAQAIPVNSHCGTESAGPRSSFVSHDQLTRQLEQIAECPRSLRPGRVNQ